MSNVTLSNTSVLERILTVLFIILTFVIITCSIVGFTASNSAVMPIEWVSDSSWTGGW